MFVKLKIAETFDFTFVDGSTTAQQVIVAANNVTDPFSASASVQMYGLDQWANFYTYARVHGCKVRGQVTPAQDDGGTSNTAGYWAYHHILWPSIYATGITTDDLAAQMPYAKSKVANIYDIKSQILTGYMSTAKVFGVTPMAVKTEDNYRTLTTGITDPTNVWYWHYTIVPHTGVTGTQDQRFKLVLLVVMYVELSGQRQLGAS